MTVIDNLKQLGYKVDVASGPTAKSIRDLLLLRDDSSVATILCVDGPGLLTYVAQGDTAAISELISSHADRVAELARLSDPGKAPVPTPTEL